MKEKPPARYFSTIILIVASVFFLYDILSELLIVVDKRPFYA
jgi:hypothetical protein